jgi:nucleoside-diphosphate-sugar epimerase
MKILFIGGTGNISWYCVTKAQQAGYKVWILNRGRTIKTRRPRPLHIKQLFADMRDVSSVKNILKDMNFDVVVDFICYTPDQALVDIELFRNITKQFIFISSTANYQRPSIMYPITESTQLHNPYWEYAQNKIDCEKIFLEYYQKENFPITIVRPGHTYDTIIPDAVGNGDWTNAKRMIDGKPIVIHGDGSTLWTLTHSEDFARAFIKLFKNPATIGEAFHITSDELLTWKQISEVVASTLNVKNPRFLYIPSEIIAQLNPVIGNGLLGHKTWCDIYDNSKIKSVAKGWQANITFKKGIQRTIDWLKNNKNRQRINLELDLFLDDLCENFYNYYSKITKRT